MVRIVPINLPYNPRKLWFDPLEFDIHKDDPVIVETARGTEFGRVADEIFEADESTVKAFNSPIKPIKRVADYNDIARADKLEERGHEALGVFKDLVEKCNLDMRPISVEFLFDGNKAIFYFEAEERVDFRELVRKLASRFHIRVDMRQIGVRDEARIVGGIGHCGQELCCKRMGANFDTVSIRMAKEQGLSLNPQSISGLCGRLMCCLRFEYNAYKNFKSRAPKINSQIKTPAGLFKVIELDVPREKVCLQDEEGKKVHVPLCDFETDEEDKRPCSIGDSAWQRATEEVVSGYAFDSALSQSLNLSDDNTFDNTGGSGKSKNRKRNARSGSSHKEESSEIDKHSDSTGEAAHKTRHRRSTKIASRSTLEDSAKQSVRVGQKSSGLSRSGKKNSKNKQSKVQRNSNQEKNKSKRNNRSQPSKNHNESKRPENSSKQKAAKKTSDISQSVVQNKQAGGRRQKRSHPINASTEERSSKNDVKNDGKKGVTGKQTTQKGKK